jgi:hypothetical protein
MNSVSTALQVANRLAGVDEGIEPGPERKVPRRTDGKLDQIRTQARSADDRLSANRDDLDAIARPESVSADMLRRRLTDALSLSRLLQSELTFANIAPVWLHRFGVTLKQYPKIIAAAARAIHVTADIFDWAHHKWIAYQENLLKITTRTSSRRCN